MSSFKHPKGTNLSSDVFFATGGGGQPSFQDLTEVELFDLKRVLAYYDRIDSEKVFTRDMESWVWTAAVAKNELHLPFNPWNPGCFGVQMLRTKDCTLSGSWTIPITKAGYHDVFEIQTGGNRVVLITHLMMPVRFTPFDEFPPRVEPPKVSELQFDVNGTTNPVQVIRWTLGSRFWIYPVWPRPLLRRGNLFRARLNFDTAGDFDVMLVGLAFAPFTELYKI